jgi:hypothetical protein
MQEKFSLVKITIFCGALLSLSLYRIIEEVRDLGRHLLENQGSNKDY